MDSTSITYNGSKDEFTFDFEHDDGTDIIKLHKEIQSLEFFGSVLKFSYEFDESISSSLRTKFIHDIKFKSNISDSDRNRFVRIAVSKLCNSVDMSRFKCIVFPESNSDLVSLILRSIKQATSGKLLSFQLVKLLPKDIQFDYDSFIQERLESKTEDGKPRYTEKQKQEVLENISKMMDDVHKLNYFSIARNFKGKYRVFLNNYYRFSSQKDKEDFDKIKDEEILVVDDIATTGTTMTMLLKTLGVLGSEKVILFSIIGTHSLRLG